jgi:flagellar biosynthetic protein FliP
METAGASIVFLVLVAFVALGVGLFARSWRRQPSHSKLRVLSTLELGHRERLVEVLQGDEVLLLGVTSQQVQVIDRRKASPEELSASPLMKFSGLGRVSMRLLTLFFLFLGSFALIAPSDVLAQNIPLFEAVPAKGGGTNYSVPVQTVILLTALSFLPAMLMLMTSFTRILIVLSLLRQAMGLVTTPPNAVLVGLALFITAAVMAPVTEKVYADAWQPYVAGRINFEQALDRGVEPVKAFMLRQTRADDLNLFVKLSGKTYAKPEDVPLTAVIPAFAISEIRSAFLIGFVIYLPFLAIDFAVASILTALGMVMVSPITFSLPLKLIVFVLADGWAMLIGGLVDSFKMSA